MTGAGASSMGAGVTGGMMTGSGWMIWGGLGAEAKHIGSNSKKVFSSLLLQGPQVAHDLALANIDVDQTDVGAGSWSCFGVRLVQGLDKGVSLRIC